MDKWLRKPWGNHEVLKQGSWTENLTPSSLTEKHLNYSTSSCLKLKTDEAKAKALAHGLMVSLFHMNGLFLYPLKTSGNIIKHLKISGVICFQEVQKVTSSRKWVKNPSCRYSRIYLPFLSWDFLLLNSEQLC